MALEHESQVTPSASDAGEPPSNSGERLPSGQATPAHAAPAADSRLAAAQRKAAAAREAAERIRAKASQYRITPEPPASTHRQAQVRLERQQDAEPTAPPGPAVPLKTAPPADVAQTSEVPTWVERATLPPPRVRPRFPPKADSRVTETPATPAPAAGRPSTRFRPMRRPDAEAPAFPTAYGFRSAMGARSAGRLLIGEAQPIRPSRARRRAEVTTVEAPRPREGSSCRASDQLETRPDPLLPPSRFNRLSQDLADRQTWLGVDPATLQEGGLADDSAQRSRWGRLTSWLFGGKRDTTG